MWIPEFYIVCFDSKAQENYTPTPYKGTFYTDKFSQSDHFFLETAFYYPFITTKHMGTWGEQLSHVMTKYHQLMAILVLNHDKAHPDNRIKTKANGRIVLDYKLSAESLLSLCQAQQAASQIFTAAGATEVVMPCSREKILPASSADFFAAKIRPKFYRSISVPISSAHPQGGARMGNDRKAFCCQFMGTTTRRALALCRRRQPFPPEFSCESPPYG